MNCQWCGSDKAERTNNTVYWELPDGTKTIEIRETPSVHCSNCGMTYQSDEMVKEIEDQLFLINTTKLEKSMTYETLMAVPRILKRNYFDFSK
ncbi:YokU family protein [Bacillus sp. BRMEA1]|uniref:YokU family protein n=1 Tax=Neobacillus endophyticus TaxID=2738405 RepID=UPI001C27AB99|nr:YokU family protein [Neobacillus endophyticus]NRD76541.1 YokU family protein [Neobacillus endophyticus]